MPEGAEVRRNGDLIRNIINGKLVVKAEAVSGKLLRNGVKGSFNLPSEVIDVSTRGKAIFIKLYDGVEYSWLISTLGMSGWWYPGQIDEELSNQKVYVNGQNAAADIKSYIDQARKYNRYEITIENGNTLFYTDPRNFGNLYFTDYEGYKKKWNSIGIDMSYPGNDIEAPLEVLRLKRLAKKFLGEVLLNQSILSGIGNIYRAEALYLAGLSPFRTVESCSDKELKLLINMASLILNIAYTTQGVMKYDVKLLSKMTHFNITNALTINGHLVYTRYVDPLGRLVKKDICAGRTMWWVPGVQA